MSHLSLRAIKAYTYCPLFYRFKYVLEAGKLPDSRDLLEQILRRTGLFILYHAQGGQYPSKSSVSHAYNRLAKTVLQSMKRVRQNAPALQSGIQTALHMLDYFKKSGSIPVLISLEGKIRYDDTDITVPIDGILDRCGQLKAVSFVTWTENEYGILPVDPEVSAIWLVSQRILSKPIRAVVIYHLFDGTSEEIATHGLEVRSVEQMLAAAVRGIKQEIFFPSAGRPCRKCLFYHFCIAGKTEF